MYILYHSFLTRSVHLHHTTQTFGMCVLYRARTTRSVPLHHATQYSNIRYVSTISLVPYTLSTSAPYYTYWTWYVYTIFFDPYWARELPYCLDSATSHDSVIDDIMSLNHNLPNLCVTI